MPITLRTSGTRDATAGPWFHGVMGSSDDKTLDLRTVRGLDTALRVLDSPLGWLAPTLKLAKLAYDCWTSRSDVSPEMQAQAAERIIEAGRKNGAKRLRFVVGKDAGAMIKANVKGVDVKGGVGVNGTMELEVEFK